MQYAFSSSSLTEDRALYFVEAIFKSSAENLRLIVDVSAFDKKAIPTWHEFKAFATKAGPILMMAWIDVACVHSESVTKVCMVEDSLDVLLPLYQPLLKSMDDGFHERDPEARLAEILDISEQLGVPRVKLRLLLEFTAWADGFDSSDIQHLGTALEEIESTLKCMPENAITQVNGGWFYKRGIEEVRDFIENYWNS